MNKQELKHIRDKNAYVRMANPPRAVIPDALALDEITALVSDYNQAEAEQEARLKLLFAFMLQRKGNRYVTFGAGDKWTNFPNPAERPDLGMAQYVKPHVQFISEVQPGTE